MSRSRGVTRGQCSCRSRRCWWRVACPHFDGPSRPTLLVCPTEQENGRRRGCAGSSGKVPGRPNNVLQSVNLTGEERRHGHLTHDPLSRKHTPRVRAHTRPHVHVPSTRKGDKARPLVAQTNQAEWASLPASVTAVVAQTPKCGRCVEAETGPRAGRLWKGLGLSEWQIAWAAFVALK